MIQDAPYCSDPSRIVSSAAPDDYPLAFISDARRPGPLNRYSLISSCPLLTVSAASPDGPIRIEDPRGERPVAEFDTFERAVAAALAPLGPPVHWGDTPWDAAAPPFTGGLAGYLGYEFGGHFERMPRRDPDEIWPALWLGLYTSVYVIDHVLRRAWWVSRDVGGAEPNLRQRMAESREKLVAWVEGSIGNAASALDSPPSFPLPPDSSPDWRRGWEASLDPSAYQRAVDRLHQYLRDGDIYQANLTVRYRKTVEIDPQRLFTGLLQENPAPFAAYLGSPERSVLSSSPELLLHATSDGRIETRPIKGTVASPDGQGSGPAEELLRSAKDRAEHIMIVDLERNDLGRVCRTGSVHVDPLFAVEKFTGLQHLVSRVGGQLRPGAGACEAIRALFPGGSITGAPKIRAMEIIHELEPVPRGVYTGAIGWISPEGDARMNLAIRTLAYSGRRLDLHVGGGIVIDSTPDAEWEECRIKGEAMARAVSRAQAAALRTLSGP